MGEAPQQIQEVIQRIRNFVGPDSQPQNLQTGNEQAGGFYSYAKLLSHLYIKSAITLRIEYLSDYE